MSRKRDSIQGQQADRQVFAGGPQNIIQARTGGKGGGRGPRGAG